MATGRFASIDFRAREAFSGGQSDLSQYEWLIVENTTSARTNELGFLAAELRDVFKVRFVITSENFFNEEEGDVKLFKHLGHAQEIELECKWGKAAASRMQWSKLEEIVAKAEGVRIVKVSGLLVEGYAGPQSLTPYSPFIAFGANSGFAGATTPRDVAREWAEALDHLRLRSPAPIFSRSSWVSAFQRKFAPRNSQLALEGVEKLDGDLAMRINASARSIDALALRVASFSALRLEDVQNFFAELLNVREVIFQGTFELALMHIADVTALTRHQSVVRFMGFKLTGDLAQLKQIVRLTTSGPSDVMYAATPIIDPSCRFDRVSELPRRLVEDWNERMRELRTPQPVFEPLPSAQSLSPFLTQPPSPPTEQIEDWVGEIAREGEEEEGVKVQLTEKELQSLTETDNDAVTELSVTEVTDLSPGLAGRIFESFPNVDAVRVELKMGTEAFQEKTPGFFWTLASVKLLHVQSGAKELVTLNTIYLCAFGLQEDHRIVFENFRVEGPDLNANETMPAGRIEFVNCVGEDDLDLQEISDAWFKRGQEIYQSKLPFKLAPMMEEEEEIDEDTEPEQEEEPEVAPRRVSKRAKAAASDNFPIYDVITIANASMIDPEEPQRYEMRARDIRAFVPLLRKGERNAFPKGVLDLKAATDTDELVSALDLFGKTPVTVRKIVVSGEALMGLATAHDNIHCETLEIDELFRTLARMRYAVGKKANVSRDIKTVYLRGAFGEYMSGGVKHDFVNPPKVDQTEFDDLEELAFISTPTPYDAIPIGTVTNWADRFPKLKVLRFIGFRFKLEGKSMEIPNLRSDVDVVFSKDAEKVGILGQRALAQWYRGRELEREVVAMCAKCGGLVL